MYVCLYYSILINPLGWCNSPVIVVVTVVNYKNFALRNLSDFWIFNFGKLRYYYNSKKGRYNPVYVPVFAAGCG